MWDWLFQQPTVWMEITLGVVFTIAALFLEDLIDRWRGRKS